MFNISYSRSQFPALNQDFIFMDNAGGAHTCLPCINNITKYLSTCNVQLGASYRVSQNASNLMSESHDKLKEWINAPRKEEVIVYSSATMLLRMLSICLSDSWEKGDEIIITNTEHEANGSCWTELAQKGIIVKIWEFNPEDYELNLEDLKKLMTSKTKLVAVCQTSNIFGTINDVAAISDLVHANGSLICVDGVAFAPHNRVDVQKMKVDFYVFSCYKVFGPHIGLMYGKHELLQKMRGFNHYFIDSVPYKFQPGNYNFELMYGLSGVYDYLMEVAKENNVFSNDVQDTLDKVHDLMTDHEELLVQRLLDYLNSVPDLKIIGRNTADKNQRVPTLSFVHTSMKSDAIVTQVDKHSIGIRFGDFYAKGIAKSLDLEKSNGVVRVSLVHYNTMEEVEKLIAVFKTIF